MSDDGHEEPGLEVPDVLEKYKESSRIANGSPRSNAALNVT